MKLCNPKCIPCCDFCKHAIHDEWDDEYGHHIGGPEDCSLHKDAEHKTIAEGCGYCDDFCCFRVKEISDEAVSFD